MQPDTPPIQTITQLIAGDSLPASGPNPAAWNDIAITAIVLGLAPLLHWRLEQQQLTVPPLTAAKLKVTRQAHAKRNQSIAAQVSEILAACHRAQLPVMVLKGALLAPLAYPEPGLRPMNDIDLLFQPDDLPRVAALLEALGYRGKYKAADHGPGITKHLSTYRRDGNEAATPNPYLSAAGDRMVEPHGSLEESWFGLKVDITPGVWQRAVPVTLHGQPARRLSTADMVLHLAVHAAFHVIMGAAAFVQLYDLGRVLATWPAEIDWSHLLNLAAAASAQPFLYAALHWAHTLFRVPIPAEPLAAFRQACPAHLLAHIHHLDAVALFQRTQSPPLRTLSQRLQQGLWDRREAARWAGSPADKWRIWQTALAVHKTDTLALLLGKKLKVET